MSSGLPPTPPPTSATEIQDEAREQAEALALADASTSTSDPPASTLAPNAQTVFQVIVPTLVGLAEQGDFERLIRQAEEADVNADDDRHPSRLLITSVLVLAYLIRNDLPPARFALMRLPDNLSTTPIAQALFNLFASTWEREYAKVYMRSENLHQLVAQADPPAVAAALRGMITTFVASFRERTFNLLEKAYTSLPLALAQTYLGLPVDELLAAAERRRWSYDAANKLFSPPLARPALPEVDVTAPSSVSTFHHVSERVARLEL